MCSQSYQCKVKDMRSEGELGRGALVEFPPPNPPPNPPPPGFTAVRERERCGRRRERGKGRAIEKQPYFSNSRACRARRDTKFFSIVSQNRGIGFVPNQDQWNGIHTHTQSCVYLDPESYTVTVYSGTSDKGPSEIGKTSLQRTLVAAQC